MEAIYPKRSLSHPGEGHRIYPYLLKDLEISGPDQVWCSDIMNVPMAGGYMNLVATMDWWSRYVLAWELSNSMDSEFCIRTWERALMHGRAPLIANTDQGSQFTSEAYLDAVESAGVDVSMDGRGRWIDNRFSSVVHKCIANLRTALCHWTGRRAIANTEEILRSEKPRRRMRSGIG